jgi:hypothetical protein
VVEVHCDEDVASHIGPESCAGIREDVGEALTGEGAGQPLSRERLLDQDADTVPQVEGNMGGRGIASGRSILRGHRTWHVPKLFAREPGDLQLDHWQHKRGGPQREGEEP